MTFVKDDDFFVNEIFECSIELTGGNGQLAQLGNMVRLMVGQEVKNALASRCKAVF